MELIRRVRAELTLYDWFLLNIYTTRLYPASKLEEYKAGDNAVILLASK